MTYNTVLTYLSTKLSDTFKYYPQDLCIVYLPTWMVHLCGLNAGECTSSIDPMGYAVVTSAKTQLTDQGWAPIRCQPCERRVGQDGDVAVCFVAWGATVVRSGLIYADIFWTKTICYDYTDIIRDIHKVRVCWRVIERALIEWVWTGCALMFGQPNMSSISTVWFKAAQLRRFFAAEWSNATNEAMGMGTSSEAAKWDLCARRWRATAGWNFF